MMLLSGELVKTLYDLCWAQYNDNSRRVGLLDGTVFLVITDDGDTLHVLLLGSTRLMTIVRRKQPIMTSFVVVSPR